MTLLEKPAATPAIALLDRLTRVPNFVFGRSAGAAGTSASALCVVIPPRRARVPSTVHGLFTTQISHPDKV